MISGPVGLRRGVVVTASKLSTEVARIGAVFVGRFGPRYLEPQVPSVRKVLQIAAMSIRLIPANSEKGLDGKEGVAGSSPAEGS